MQKYTKYVKICKHHPRHLYKFLLRLPGDKKSRTGSLGWALAQGLSPTRIP